MTSGHEAMLDFGSRGANRCRGVTSVGRLVMAARAAIRKQDSARQPLVLHGSGVSLMSDDHTDLPDRIAAAVSLNRLSHALVRHRADPTVLRAIAREAERLATSIEDEPIRQRRMELVSLPEFDEAVEHGSLTDLLEEGAFVDTFDDSPVSGSANPLSMGLQVGRDGETAVGRAMLAPGWQGAPDRAHGGVVAAIIDEVYGALLPIIGVMAFTGELTVRYEAPCPLGVQLDFRAEKIAVDGRKLYLSCEGRSEQGVFATSQATFISIDLDQFRAAKG